MKRSTTKRKSASIETSSDSSGGQGKLKRTTNASSGSAEKLKISSASSSSQGKLKGTINATGGSPGKLKQLSSTSGSSQGNLNEDFCSALLELADWEKNVERNQFKHSAYKKAAAVISGLDYRITSGEEARKLPGIGDKISKKIDELIATGKLRKLETIREDEESVTISLLTRVSGIGPAKAKDLYEAGVRSLEDLRGEAHKLTHAQQVGLNHFRDFELKIPRQEVRDLFDRLEQAVLALDPGYTATVCGSYRRGVTESGDIDVLLTHAHYRHSGQKHGGLLHRVVETLEGEGLMTDRISEGDTKFMGVCRLNQQAHFRRLDIRLLPVDQYYCGLLYFTGSDLFNKNMRTAALHKGFTLNEYSLRPLLEGEAQEPLPVSSERDVFDYIDFQYKDPEDRN